MALAAGRLHFTVEFAKDIKDKDWFGRQDPYAKVFCGSQQLRTRTHVDGGRNPVWNETFQFSIINENDVRIELYDSDNLSRDDHIGGCIVSLAQVRQRLSDHQQVPVVSKHSGKQHGFVSVSMRFEPNAAPYAAAPAYAPAPGYYQPQPAPGYYAPQQPQYAAPPPTYYAPAPTQSYAQNALGGYPPAQYPGYPPAPAPYGAPPHQGHYPSAAPGYPPSAPAPSAYPPPPMNFYGH